MTTLSWRRLGRAVGVLLLSCSAALTFAAEESAGRLRILLVNDDGYRASGLVALAEALEPIADLIVAGPARQESGTGHAVTSVREPILVRRVTSAGSAPWYAISARPASCARVALEALIEEEVQLVISGINAGTNLGVVSFYSGPVGAAREAVIAGYPAIAVSLAGEDAEDYHAAAQIMRRLVDRLHASGALRPGLFLNVNLPAGIAKENKGLRVVRQSLAPTRYAYERRRSPAGQLYFWGRFRPLEDKGLGTDVGALNAGYITVVPLSIDQTAANRIDVLRSALAAGEKLTLP